PRVTLPCKIKSLYTFTAVYVYNDLILHGKVTRGSIVVHIHGRVRWQGKPNALISRALRHNGRIDSDDLPGHVHQRPARITGIDGGVRLQEVLELSADAAAVLGADDTGSHRRLQPEWATNRENPVTDFDTV